MLWALEDGSHRGRTMMMLATGEMLGALADGSPGTVGAYVPVGVGLGSAVVGWAVVCSCGWRGPTWNRVPDPWHMDVTRHLAYCDDDLPASGVLQGMLQSEWTSHVQPRAALEALERRIAEHVEAVQQVDAAVRDARSHGASWAAVAAVAGISRQSAHQRWAKG